MVLDTHVLLWWVDNPDSLPSNTRKRIEKSIADQAALVSSISVWEIHMLVRKTRLKLRIDPSVWIQKVVRSGLFQFVPIDNDISTIAAVLPQEIPRDPADRMIIATALNFGVPLISKDEKILRNPVLSKSLSVIY